MTAGRKAGFTILELLVVVGILAALVGLGVPYYQDYLAESRHAVMRSNLHAIRKALMEYYGDRKTYPGDILYLSSPTADPGYAANPTQKYLLEHPTDPEPDAPASWGYSTDGVTYNLHSKYSSY